MHTLENLWTLFVLIVAFLGFGVVACLPNWLGRLAGRSLGDAQESLIRQTEIERKVMIAEEARAARARGETYVPPADYDR
jgi:hypothetical protein